MISSSSLLLDEREETQEPKSESCSDICFISDKIDFVFRSEGAENMISAAKEPGGGDLRDKLCLLRSSPLERKSSRSLGM